MNQIQIKAKKIFKKKKTKAQDRLIGSKIAKLRRLNEIISKHVPCYTFDYVTENLQEKLNNRKPFKITKIPDMFGSPDNTEEQVSRMLEGQNSLDISVSENNVFSGHYTEHKTISLSFDEFLNYQGQFNLYLAQFPFYEKQTVHNTPLNQNNLQEKNEQNLQKLFQFDSNFKAFCSRFKNDIHRINLWFSKKETSSSLHYDSYDNFLFMLKGKKVFYVSPPDDENIACESVLTNSFQQAKSIKKTKPRFEITLRENEGIFLPQGWFHEVTSIGNENIIAINIWFNSIEDICAHREKYLLRYLIANRIEKEIGTLIKVYKESFRLRPSPAYPNSFSQEIRTILEEFIKDKQSGVKIFLRTLFSVPNSLLRTFILEILSTDPEITQQILLALDNYAVEYLTKRLEEIDNALPNLNGQDTPTIDEFYTTLNQKLEYQSIMNHFIQCKKQLRKKVLKSVLYKKLANSYKF